jgi:hypothetical protein
VTSSHIRLNPQFLQQVEEAHIRSANSRLSNVGLRKGLHRDTFFFFAKRRRGKDVSTEGLGELFGQNTFREIELFSHLWELDRYVAKHVGVL